MSKLPQVDHCPECDSKLDAATFVRDESKRPRPGDLSICVYCGTFLRFDNDLRHEKLQHNELMSLPPGQRAELFKVRDAVVAAIRERS